MFVHLIDVNNIYSKKYVDFVEEQLGNYKNIFTSLSISSLKSSNSMNPNDIRKLSLLNPIHFYQLFSILKKSKHNFLHSLFDWKLLLLLNVFPFFARKSSWILWGGDLYNYWIEDKHTLKQKLREFLKRRIIRQVHSIVCLVEEDYQFAKEKYPTNAVYRYAFYPNPVDFISIDQSIQHNHKNSPPQILVGNSASNTNNHFEILDAIKKLSIKDFNIICPLSYGDKEYAKSVLNYGKSLFGENFIALIDLLPPEKYAEILSNVDVAVFAHKRQQALGNILALLYAGKKVYVRSDISTWRFLNRLGITVFDTTKILNGEDKGIFNFDPEVGKKNREIVRREFSEERCAQLWKAIFDEILQSKKW